MNSEQFVEIQIVRGSANDLLSVVCMAMLFVDSWVSRFGVADYSHEMCFKDGMRVFC